MGNLSFINFKTIFTADLMHKKKLDEFTKLWHFENLAQNVPQIKDSWNTNTETGAL